MKTIERLSWVITVIMVAGISFLATFYFDWPAHALLSVAFGVWFGLTLVQPSLMESDRMVSHLWSVVYVLPFFIIHVGMQFFVNELTRRGIGYSMSGFSYIVEVPWAMVSALAFVVAFMWGRTHIKSVY